MIKTSAMRSKATSIRTSKALRKNQVFPWDEVSRSRRRIHLCRRKYILDILEECGLSGAKPLLIPMEENLRLDTESGEALKDPEKYRRLIGRL